MTAAINTHGDAASIWSQAPLAATGQRGGKRRNLNDLPSGFLHHVINAAEPQFLGFAYRNHHTWMQQLWGSDTDDITAELRLLLVEAATRFDGRGDFAGWACGQLRNRLADASRRQLGRQHSDLNIKFMRLRVELGRDPTVDDMGCTPSQLHDLHQLQQLRHAINEHVITNEGTTVSVLETGQPITSHSQKVHGNDRAMPSPDAAQLVNHADAEVRRAAKKVLSAQEVLVDVLGAYNSTAVLRQRAAELEAELSAIRTELRGKNTRRASRAGKKVGQSGVHPKQIRQWAADNSIECPVYGRVPQRIIDQYDAAH